MIRVLVVDDSGFFRRRVAEMLESDPEISVVDTAENGLDAIEKAKRLKPDVITMDIEMPVMDGIEATRRIVSREHIPVLMFSSLSHEGAKATLEALDAGAVDYLPKRFEDISKDRAVARRALCEKVKSIAGGLPGRTQIAPAVTPELKGRAVIFNKLPVRRQNPYSLVAIGASTGGPVALQRVLSSLPVDYPSPILLLLHMPASFTAAFAERLNSVCDITVREARNGDELKPGLALLAPGGQQTLVRKIGGRLSVRLSEASPEHNYKPCIDISFNSIAKLQDTNVLAIVLTGMGADGCDGARSLKAGGGSVWAQDKATSVIYGMPAAVVEAGLADCVLALEDIGGALVKSAA